MAILEEKQREQLEEVFANLEHEAKIVMFTQQVECEYCAMTRELLEKISGLSDKLSLSVHDFVADAELAKGYRVDKIPAIILLGDHDYGIRFYGIPAGYEFTTLIEDIMDISRRDHGLSEEVTTELNKVDQPVHIQVMILTTCPNCPMAVRTAHRFAMANEHITADMVETQEFPNLAVKYHVHGVPHTIINEEHSFGGPVPEIEMAREVLKAIGR